MSPTIQRTIAKHSGPVLMKKKAAALFTTDECKDIALLKNIAEDLESMILRYKAGRALVLVYRPSMLTEALSNPEVAATLAAIGYPAGGDLREMLRHLRRRIAEQGEFPHEIGFFLGYPAEDVVGFICHKGDDYKLCGPWKVYGDVSRAQKLFKEYEECRQMMARHIERGGTLLDLQNLKCA